MNATPHSIAEMLTGRSAEALAITREPFDSGGANLGCFLHTVFDGEQEVCRFVEKRTNRAREIGFALHHASVYAGSFVVPRIFGMQRESDHATIFMEYFEGVHPTLEPTRENAKLLAEAVASLYKKDLAGEPATLLNSHLLQVPLFPEPSVVETVQRLESRMRQLPLVPSHNDINLQNIAVSERGIRFIDWGQFSPNVIGADFHHFVAASLIKPKFVKFTERAIFEYAGAIRKHGLSASKRDIRFGAHYYALVRLMSRYALNHEEKIFHRALSMHALLQERIKTGDA